MSNIILDLIDILAVLICIVLIVKLINKFNELTKEINHLKKENDELKTEININKNDDFDIYKYAHNYKIETIDNETIIKVMFPRCYKEQNKEFEDLYEFLAHLNKKFDNKEITVIINSGDVVYNPDGFAKHYNFNNVNLKISTLCKFHIRWGGFFSNSDYREFLNKLYSNNFKSIDYYSYKDKNNYKYRI